MPTRKGNRTRRPSERRIPALQPEVQTPATVTVEQVLETPEVEVDATASSIFWAGASLYPIDKEMQAATDWYARDLTGDLDALAKARAGIVRLFASWRVLEPQVGQYAGDALDALSSAIRAAHARDLRVIVVLMADDRHGELSEVVWSAKRDPRTDTYMLQRQAALAQAIAGHLRGEPGLYAWQLGNEGFLSGFAGAESLDAWFTLMHEALREIDPTRPIALGADTETLFSATGIDARATAARGDFVVSHVTASYRAYAAGGPIDSGPSTYLDAYLARVASRGLPVLLDEIGAIELDHSAAEEAAHLRTALWGGLMNRAWAGMARRLRDMDTERREPYFLDPFETLVGLSDTDGIPKPAFKELADFARTAERIDLATHSLVAERVAVILPDERYAPLPSLSGLYAPRATLQAFIAAKEAHAPVAIIAEDDDFDDYLVVVVPSAFTLAASTWERLAAFVQGGGTVLLSYGGGDGVPAYRELFGLEFLGDGGPRDSLSCRVAQPDVLGAIRSFDARLEIPGMAQLAAATATVVATDERGGPLLTVNQVGQGRAVFVAVPLERAIAQDDPWSTPEPVRFLMRELYGAVVRGAGAGMPVTVDDAAVEIALFQGADDDIVVLLNHTPAARTVEVAAERPIAYVADVRTGKQIAIGAAALNVPLGPNGATALRVVYE